MPGGIGPNWIGPGVGDIWQNITGQKLGPGENNDPQNWFGTNPMEGATRTQDWGRLGGFVARGPQSTSYQRSGIPLAEAGGAGLLGALFGGSYDPAFGESAYQRFQDSGDAFGRRYATDLTDEQGNVIGFSPLRGAGARSMSTFGGRTAFDKPLTGQEYGGHKEFAGLAALQQGTNPYLNDPRQAAAMARAGEQSSPFARADPNQWLASALRGETGRGTGEIAGSYINEAFNRGGVSVEDMARMASGAYGDVTGDVGDIAQSRYGGTVGDVQGMTNAYEQSLLDQMQQQGSKDLATGLQDAQSTLSAMGLGRSGQGQSTAAGVWADIQQKNALDRQNLMAQFRQAAMEREAGVMGQMGQAALGAEAGAEQAMGLAGLDANARAILAQQGGGINAILAAQQAAAQGNESRLGRANQAIMGGLGAQNASFEGSRAAERGALLGGQEGTRQWNLGTQGNYLQSLLGHDQASLNRMIAESNAQSQGLRDYQGLWDVNDRMRAQRQEEMLGLEDRQRAMQNEVLNQMQHYGNRPLDTLIAMMTGIAPSGGSPARTSPWGPMLAQAGLNYGMNLAGQASQPMTSSLNTAIFGGGETGALSGI